MIKKLSAKDRLENLLYDKRYGEEPFFGELPTYKCKKCNEITNFNLESRKPFEPEAIEAEFNKRMRKLKPWEEDYCNFQCRVCKQPIRCIYQIHEFAMSSYHYYPTMICLYENKS